MPLREISKARRQKEEFVSISGKYKRLHIFQKAYERLKEKAGFEGDLNFVRIFVDDKDRGKFWIRLDSSEGLAIRIVGKENRIVAVYNLLAELGWNMDDTVRLPIAWDSKNKAYLVDCRDALKQRQQQRMGRVERSRQEE